MKFKISYRTIIWNVVLIDLLVAFVALVSHLGHHPMSNGEEPYIMLIIDALFFVYLIISPPPKYIQIDKNPQVLSYCLLFRYQAENINYIRLRSEWKMRYGARGSSWMELVCYADEQIIFTLTSGMTGWTKAELDKMHLYLSKK
ncbi:hypothetical protein ACFQ48_02985 [Hymenobacter caeli]|uniref:PH domain-containing protein n=1 Tax=Hymenobacter caeli TaxID=2735894 RepID=A0ABX2FKZ8_9BACT|nr:hypothetical protein [Hymenobacter caeli]NRT17789.1 hypothetical protein [Hymenobacter caeli]